jgi:hypothetical protein
MRPGTARGFGCGGAQSGRGITRAPVSIRGPRGNERVWQGAERPKTGDTRFAVFRLKAAGRNPAAPECAVGSALHRGPAAARRKAGDRRHSRTGRDTACGTHLLAAQMTPGSATKASRLSVVRRSRSADAMRGNSHGGDSVRGRLSRSAVAHRRRRLIGRVSASVRGCSAGCSWPPTGRPASNGGLFSIRLGCAGGLEPGQERLMAHRGCDAAMRIVP